MVASKVEVTSRPAFGDNAEASVWVSDGLGTFTIDPATGDAPRRGTVIKAWLKDDATEFAEKFRVESVIRKHSAFVPFPVLVDGERVNTQPALWREPKFSVTKEQYDSFYKALTYDAKDPLDTLHLSVDAPVQFNALLFTPDSAQDFFGADREYWGLDLYARRVLIQHRNKELVPEYLAFLKGVVDTEDLPLNISRETLQENVVLRKISQVLVKQALGHLEKLASNDAEKYSRFWQLHGLDIHVHKAVDVGGVAGGQVHAQRVAHKVDHCGVFGNVGILAENRAGFGLFHIAFNTDDAFAVHLGKKRVKQGQRFEVVPLAGTRVGKQVLEAFDNQAKGVLGLRTKKSPKTATQNDDELGGLKKNAPVAVGHGVARADRSRNNDQSYK